MDNQYCEACNSLGWIIADNDVYGLRIERCDSCQRFASDEEAVIYVDFLARRSMANG